MPTGTVHNIFIDHVDHSGESKQHHHHGADDNDILWHKHDKWTVKYDEHGHILDHYDGEGVNYGPANHTHDEPATDDLNKSLHAINEHRDNLDLVDDGAGHIVIHPKPTDESTSVDWADDIDNLTGNDPYGHLVYPDDLKARDI